MVTLVAYSRATLAALLLVTTCYCVSAQEVVPVTDVVEQAIDDLRSRSFAKRQRAAEALIREGGYAITLVEATAKRGGPEQVERCVEILAAMAQNPASRESALDALDRIASDTDGAGAKLAKERVFALRETKRDRAVRELQSAGVHVHLYKDQVRSVHGIYRDKHCSLIQHLPAVNSVGLMGGSVTDKSLDRLKNAKSLHSLSIIRTSIGDSGMGKLAELPGLNTLSIDGENVSPFGLRRLADVEGLQAFTMSREVTRQDLDVLGSIELRSLGLSRIVARPEIVDALGQLKMASLNLSMQSADDSSLQWVKSSKASVISLNLRSSPDLTSKAFDPLAGSNIRSLMLSGLSIDDEAMRAIGQCAELRSLYVYDCDISDAGLEHLTGLEKLMSMNLRDTKVSEEAFEAFKKGMPNLKYARQRKTNR